MYFKQFFNNASIFPNKKIFVSKSKYELKWDTQTLDYDTKYRCASVTCVSRKCESSGLYSFLFLFFYSILK